MLSLLSLFLKLLQMIYSPHGSANYGALTLIHILYLVLFWSFYSMPMMKECSICQYFPSTWDKLPVIASTCPIPLAYPSCHRSQDRHPSITTCDRLITVEGVPHLLPSSRWDMLKLPTTLNWISGRKWLDGWSTERAPELKDLQQTANLSTVYPTPYYYSELVEKMDI